MSKYIVTAENADMYLRNSDGVIETLTSIDKGTILDIVRTGGDPTGMQFLYRSDNTYIYANAAQPYSGSAPATSPSTFFTTNVKWGIGIAGGILIIIIISFLIKSSNKNNK